MCAGLRLSWEASGMAFWFIWATTPGFILQGSSFASVNLNLPHLLMGQQTARL